jgi:hypothetical protein
MELPIRPLGQIPRTGRQSLSELHQLPPLQGDETIEIVEILSNTCLLI